MNYSLWNTEGLGLRLHLKGRKVFDNVEVTPRKDIVWKVTALQCQQDQVGDTQPFFNLPTQDRVQHAQELTRKRGRSAMETTID